MQEIRDLSQKAQAAKMDPRGVALGMARPAGFRIDPNSFVPGVTATDVRVSATPEAEQQRISVRC